MPLPQSLESEIGQGSEVWQRGTSRAEGSRCGTGTGKEPAVPQTPVPAPLLSLCLRGVPRLEEAGRWNACDRNVIRADPHPRAHALTGPSSGLAPPRSPWSPWDAQWPRGPKPELGPLGAQFAVGYFSVSTRISCKPSWSHAGSWDLFSCLGWHCRSVPRGHSPGIPWRGTAGRRGFGWMGSGNV